MRAHASRGGVSCFTGDQCDSGFWRVWNSMRYDRPVRLTIVCEKDQEE